MPTKRTSLTHRQQITAPEKRRRLPSRWKGMRENIRGSQYKNISLYGRKFINGFRWSRYKGKQAYLVDLKSAWGEASLAVAVHFLKETPGKPSEQRTAFEARIRFEPKSVIIEAIQGERNAVEQIKDFEKVVGEPIAAFIVKEIETQARALGYKKSFLVKAESLEDFVFPVVDGVLPNRIKKIIQDAQSDLRPFTKEEYAQIQAARKEALPRVQKQMKKLYDGVAQSRGYKETDGPYREKDL